MAEFIQQVVPLRKIQELLVLLFEARLNLTFSQIG